MTSTPVDHPAVSAALAAAATMLGMEVVFVGRLTDDTFTFARVHGDLPGVAPGRALPRTDSFCHRLLAGGPTSTSDAAHDPVYAGTPAQRTFGIRSYVGVPILGPGGELVGTLCGVDRGCVEVDETTLSVLRELAAVVGAHISPLAAEGVVIRRTPAGWQVAGDDGNDLTSAMVLADLLADEIAPGRRPARQESAPRDELDRLRLSVRQLEHALAARVTVEQAIGVLAERQHVAPRTAFERLRRAARSRGRRVHDLAREVVASVNDRSLPLPPELAPRH